MLRIPVSASLSVPHINDDAICVRRWDWSETSQTVSLLTRRHGIIRGLAKGAKREKGRFSGGIDLLARGQIVAIVKQAARRHSSEDAPMATLTEWSISELYPALRNDLAANRAGLYIADVVNHMVIDQDPHPRVFDALATALARLGNRGMIDVALMEFQWTLLREAGYQPELHHDIESGGELATRSAAITFLPERGGFTAGSPVAGAPATSPTGWRVRGETLELLRQLADRGPAATDDPMNADSRAAEPIARANRLLAAYMRELIGSELPTLRWVFPDLAR